MSEPETEWSSTVRIDKDRRYRVFCGKKEICGDGSTDDCEFGPMDLLLASIATCFGLSCEFGIGVRQLDSRNIILTATGRKHSANDRYLGMVDICVEFDPAVPNNEMQRVVRSAKRLCTVTNSLRKDVTLNVEAKH